MRTLTTTTSRSSVLVRVQHPLESHRIVGVAHGDNDAAGADGHRFAVDGVLVLELEMVLHLRAVCACLRRLMRSEMVKTMKNAMAEDDAADRGNRLGEQVDGGRGQQDQEDREQADGNFDFADAQVRRNLPAALALVLPAQHQHGKAVEGERPDDAEGVRLAQHDDVAAAERRW